MLKNKKNKKLSNNNLITIGVMSLIIGIVLISNNYMNEKVDKAYSYMNMQLLEYNSVDTEELNESEESTETKKTTKKVDRYAKYYFGKLTIPKLSLSKGLLPLGNKYNTVKYNIEMLKGSDYPDKVNGNVILASHSGTSYVSYFKNLYKLVLGDTCYIEYNNKMYTYEIIDIYKHKKDGKLIIYRDYNTTTLTMITCSKNDKTSQTIYIAKLIEVK